MWKIELLYSRGERHDIRALSCDFFELHREQLAFFSPTHEIVYELEFPTLLTAHADADGAQPRLYFTGVERVGNTRYFQSICCSFVASGVQVGVDVQIVNCNLR